jgi:hypothetical protein
VKVVLEKATELYCDGTFSTAPEPFSQVGMFSVDVYSIFSLKKPGNFYF